jgi:hypothetical protein
MTINKMKEAIKKKFPMAYCLPIPVIQFNGGTKTAYTITGIGEDEKRGELQETKQLAWKLAYDKVSLPKQSK